MADILDTAGTEQVGPTGTSGLADIWSIPSTLSIAYTLLLGVIRKVLASVTSDAQGRSFLALWVCLGGCRRPDDGSFSRDRHGTTSGMGISAIPSGVETRCCCCGDCPAGTSRRGVLTAVVHPTCLFTVDVLGFQDILPHNRRVPDFQSFSSPLRLDLRRRQQHSHPQSRPALPSGRKHLQPAISNGQAARPEASLFRRCMNQLPRWGGRV